MYSTQIKIPNDQKIKLNQIAYKQVRIINGYCYDFNVPNRFLSEYTKAIYIHGSFYKEVSDLFHGLYPNNPYSDIHFRKFLKDYWGISTTIICFTNTTDKDVKGAWEWDDEIRKDSVIIRVEDTLSRDEKTLTIIHECFHIIQDIDQSFLAMVQSWHPDIRFKIADQIAEKSAIETILPWDEYDRLRRDGKRNPEIADLFSISIDIVNNYRA